MLSRILFFGITLLTSFSACKKDDATSRISSPFTVKYELVINSPISQLGPGGQYFSYLIYTNGTLQPERVDLQPGSTTWSKTVIVTSDTRPIVLNLTGKCYVTNDGDITGNIYINNELKATQTNPLNNIAQFGIWGDLNMGQSIQ